MGDFNYPDIDWNTESCRASENHPSTQFLKTCKDQFLIQHQKEATRYRVNQTPSLVDLVFSNTEDLVNEVVTEVGLGKSDHVILRINIACSCEADNSTVRYKFSKADIDKIVEELGGVDWVSELQGKDTEESWAIIKDNLNRVIETYVPKVRAKGKQRKKWMDKGTLESVRKKHKLFRKWTESRDGQAYQEYVRARNKARSNCRKAKKKLEATIAAQAKANPKAFWSLRARQTQRAV